MEQRCDGEYDCSDKSDESDCILIKDDGEYQKELPPKLDGGLVDVNVSIHILNIEKIQLPSTFDAKIEVTLIWKDYRLTYYNLHDVNIIDPETKQKLWIPPLLFSNSNENRKIKDDEKTTISITKLQGEKLLLHHSIQRNKYVSCLFQTCLKLLTWEKFMKLMFSWVAKTF